MECRKSIEHQYSVRKSIEHQYSARSERRKAERRERRKKGKGKNQKECQRHEVGGNKNG